MASDLEQTGGDLNAPPGQTQRGSGTHGRLSSQGDLDSENQSPRRGGQRLSPQQRAKTKDNLGPRPRSQSAEQKIPCFEKPLGKMSGAGSDSSTLVRNNRAESTHSIIITMKDVICGCQKGRPLQSTETEKVT